MTALSTVRPAAAPVLASRQLETLISRLSNSLEAKAGHFSKKTIPSQFAPSADERAVLDARNQALENILRPIDTPALKRAISALRGAFPAANDGHENAIMVVNLYMAALSSFPEWAVSDACRAALTGKLGGSPDFAPSPPRIAQHCRAVVANFMDERARVQAILTAEIAYAPSAEDRARVVERWEKEVRPSLSAKEEKRPKETPDEALKRLAAEASTPVAVGEGLAQKLEAMRAGK